MSSAQQQLSSGGFDGGDPRYAKFDERKRKRMISNRESARRSRMKKQQHVDELISQTSQLKNQNNLINQKINEATNMFVHVASDNNILRAQISELTDRLFSLNSILQIAEEVNGLSMDIPELPDTFLEPWQLPCPLQTTTDHMFHC